MLRLKWQGTVATLKIKSEAKSLANEMQSFEFMSMVMWCNILFAVSTVGKTPQSRDMQLDVAFSQRKGLDFMQK